MNKFDLINWNINAQPIPSIYNEGYSQFETLSKLIYQVNQFITALNNASDEIEARVTKDELTNVRKLDETGNFTGTLNGLPMSFTEQGMATDWNNAKEGFSTLTARLDYIFDQVYAQPILSLSSTPTATAFKKGTSIGSTLLSLGITKKSKDIVRVDYKRNGSIIHTNSTPNNTSDSWTDSTPITDTTTFKCTVNDGRTDTDSNTITFSAVYQMYQGKVASDVTSPNESQIKANSEIVKTKQNIVQAFTLANEKAIFAYPVGYGNLASIIDHNGFNITNSFTKTTIGVTMNDNTVQVFNVYTMNNPATVTNFNITFNF